MAERNSELNIKKSALRAAILDRNGTIIAKSTIFFNITFNGNKKELTHIKKIMKNYSYQENIKKLVFENLTWKDLSKIFANEKLPIPEIEIQQVREYMKKDITAHLTGYIKNISKTKYEGIIGIEKTHNQFLQGIEGKETFLINAQRKKLEKKETIDAKCGEGIELSIDIELQEMAYKELSKRIQGSILIADIQTGEILVAATYPSFNPEFFINKNEKEMQKYYKDELNPLFNNLLHGQFPPGSTIKPFILLALMQHNKLPASFECSGVFYLNKHPFRCWKAHGTIPLHRILPESCSYSLYSLSHYLSQSDLENIWKIFGLGEPILQEFHAKYSNLSNKKMKKLDIILTQIGQGFVITLAQLTRAYARLASGREVDFTLLKSHSNKQFAKLNVKEEHLKFLQKSLFDAVNTANSTSYNKKYKHLKMSGKTGTAQVVRIKQGEHGMGNLHKPWKERDHSLFCAFNEKIAGCIIIKHGGAGRHSANSLLKIMEKTLQKRVESLRIQ